LATTRSPRLPLGVPALVVLVVGLLLTLGLVLGARSVHDANEERLLRQRVREAGAVATAAFQNVQTPLASAAATADATDADVRPFDVLMQPLVDEGRPFVSASIWPADPAIADPAPLAVVGADPELGSEPPGEVRAFLDHARATRGIVINNLFDGPDRRLGYGLATAADARYVAYGEATLPRDRRARIDQDSAFADLDYALFIGPEPVVDNLIASSTGGALLEGNTESTRVPFGDTELLVVMSARTDLGGTWSANLWWMLGLAGLVLTVAATALVEGLTRRRSDAEELAEENAELYAAQRSVAVTLQHSLVRDDFPTVDHVEFASRYVAGVEGIEIGGDWYDALAVDDARILLAVGDVSGRGLPAATTMASLRFSIRAYATQGDSPATILRKLSELVDVSADGHFATVLCALIDLDAQTVTTANAGHPEALLVCDGSASYVDTRIGLPVGVRRGVVYAEVTQPLPAHGTLLLYTDGLVERRGEDLTVGLERLRRGAENSPGPLEAMLNAVLQQSIPDGSPDDTALLGVRWNS
jgi:serine phosphatase RsbU (regulator of sigma subunit)